MAELNKIGFHTGPSGGNSTGIGDWERALDAAGIPFCLKAVDAYGPLFEAVEIMEASGVAHVLIFRISTAGQNDGYDYDVPPYKDPTYENDPEGGAELHWQKTLDKLPPEFDKGRVWLEVVNEVDKNLSDWLGRFAIHIADLALADGYKVTLFGWSSGEPEPYHWEEPGMLDYLRVCAERPLQAAVALHEYSFIKDAIFDQYPFKIGRFLYLFATCDKHGIARPTVHITEWGWEHDDLPDAGNALTDIESVGELYSAFTNVQGAAIWYLGPGFGDIANKAQKLILPVTDFSLNYSFEGVLNPEIPQLPPVSGWEQYADPPDGGDGQLENIVIALSGEETAVRIAVRDADENSLAEWILKDLAKVSTIIVEAILDGTPPIVVPPPLQPPSPEPGDIVIDLNAYRTSVIFEGLVNGDAKKISLRTSNGLGTSSTDENGIDKMLFDHLSQTAVRKLPYDLYHFINQKDAIEPQIDLFLEIVGMCIELAGYLPEVLYLDFEKTSYETHAEIQYCCQRLYDRVMVYFPNNDFMQLGVYSSATWWNARVPEGVTWPVSLGLLNWNAYWTSSSAPAVIPGLDFRPPLMNGFSKVDLWQWSTKAGKLMGQITDPLDINYVMPLDDVPVSTKFEIGDLIKVTANALNVRDAPAGNSLGTQGSGAFGTVIGGPVFANNYHRWQIDFAGSPDGWSAEDWLEVMPQIVVPTLLGLHASADGGAGVSLEADVAEFKELQPGVVKFLTSSGPELISPIVAEMPDDCVYIVRPFLSWGGRSITAQQFYDDTVNDYNRTVNLLLDMGVPVGNIWAELHNEPNLTLEGWTFSWGSGTSFAEWGLEVLGLMRPLFPDVKWLYPGLSPGPEIPGLRTPAAGFLAESLDLVEGCDGLGVHAYWASNDPRSNALAWIDENIALVPDKPIWITEASYKSAASGDLLGNEYYQFLLGLDIRPNVYGVTFYVASASDPNFDNEVWVRNGVSRGIAATINNLK